MSSPKPSAGVRIDFPGIARAALARAPAITARWLPSGKRVGHEWVARNPRREDKQAGSFKVNLLTGCWGDFAIGVGGGDLISLAAYLFALSQAEAAKRIAGMLGAGHGSR